MMVTSALLVFQWWSEAFHLSSYIALLGFSVSVSTMAHNHNHVGIWKTSVLNKATDYWLTIFYGFPVFGWIPTHNQNHHKYNNKAEDVTRTYRYSEKNTLWNLVTYPSFSAAFQMLSIRDYLGKVRRKNPKRFRYCVSQFLVLASYLLLVFWNDPIKALVYVVIPQQVSMFSVMAFNYIQHVGADEESEYNHSRNVVGPVMNFFLFNNGFHTAHHHTPGLHWSELPKAHAEIADEIDPSLNEYSLTWLILRIYFLAPFFPRLRPRSLRLERLEREKT